jgi:plasmid stabilization system protein ParE
MAYQLVWSELAVKRLQEIFDHTAEISAETAARLVDEIFDRCEVLVSHPRIGRRYPGAPEPNIRELLVAKYRVIYELHPEVDQIWILTVRHQRRQPLYPEKHLSELSVASRAERAEKQNAGEWQEAIPPALGLTVEGRSWPLGSALNPRSSFRGFGLGRLLAVGDMIEEHVLRRLDLSISAGHKGLSSFSSTASSFLSEISTPFSAHRYVTRPGRKGTPGTSASLLGPRLRHSTR